MIYVDTNIFLYAPDNESTYFATCKLFLSRCIKEKIEITTSVETFQEVIHYLRNREMSREAIQICHNIFKIIPLPLSIDATIMMTFLKLVNKYGDIKTLQSRDLLHVAVGIENKIDTIITYDKAMSKIEEIKTLTPEQFLTAHPPQL